MSEDVFIPKFGQTVEEVTLVRWLVSEGDKLSQGQGILEVETDKAIFTVEANGKGYIHLGPYQEGQVIPVLTVVALIGKQDDKFENSDQISSEFNTAEPQQKDSKNVERPTQSLPTLDKVVFISPRAKKLALKKNIALDQVKASGFGGLRIIERDLTNYLDNQQKISPLARRVALDNDIEVENISGSGPYGRIMKEDVLDLLQKQSEVNRVNTIGSSSKIIEKIPLIGIRKIIADRMGSSVHTSARVTLIMDMDATELVKTRNRIKETFEKDWGFTPGYNDLLARIVAVVLHQCPYMNARITSENIELLEEINLGIAVDTDRGLLVPVIHNADKKNMHQFGKEFRELVDRARNNRSLPDDLAGGTFTITNLGNYDVDAFTPVINLPEAAILGVGHISPKVIPVNGEIVIRNMITLSLVFDHRLIDGAPAARFLQQIKQYVEEPNLLLAF